MASALCQAPGICGIGYLLQEAFLTPSAFLTFILAPAGQHANFCQRTCPPRPATGFESRILCIFSVSREQCLGPGEECKCPEGGELSPLSGGGGHPHIWSSHLGRRCAGVSGRSRAEKHRLTWHQRLAEEPKAQEGRRLFKSRTVALALASSILSPSAEAFSL